MASSVPTLKANLAAQLGARPGLSGVRVSNGPPLPDVPREYIWVGKADGDQSAATFGTTGGLRHERYDVEVIVSVLREGTDAVAADTRCFALANEVEAQLRTDPTVNGAVMLAEYDGFELNELVGVDGMSRTSELILSVACQTWI